MDVCISIASTRSIIYFALIYVCVIAQRTLSWALSTFDKRIGEDEKEAVNEE
jgi:hypothetical protein